ncbi:TraB/GumN family protein [Pseudidiomarina andamanensis]|uniref:TraB/GumN family protein n=1 Tax=Pseudidiomarina andamanensis TaxID=1940690 RepID=A0AA92ERZ1_9GAMM|nr:TraB/GumN family protein [Pseudidiomarina andamanensis]MDS0218315.1 TraB/GumN family protein [Pseudidiomarina andamanensis]QGT95201.1 TraB/GumN family protein [Pseudidiomarina andamanensis]
MKYLVGLIFALVSSCSFANVFYKIEHESQPTAYLFGTMHMVCHVDASLPSEVTSAFTNAKQLVVEIDLTDSAQQRYLQQNVMQQPADYLRKHLTAEQLTNLRGVVENDLGYPYQQIKSLRPIFINALFLQHFLDCDSQPLLLDEMLTQQAQVNSKAIVGLETVAEQLALFDSISLQEQVQALYEMAMNPQQNRDDLQELQSVYLNDDSDKLYEVMRSQADFDTFEQAFLSQRNKNWVTELPKLIASQPTFIAVGAGHLSGTDGLLTLLRQQGYEITPIPINFIR